MTKKSEAERENERCINSHDCNSEKTEFAWQMTGDGRNTTLHEDQKIIKDYRKED